ncbi:MAG: hypothetical protein ABI197_02875 [Granulicella sp.]
MTVLPHRELKPTPEAEATYRRWLGHLNEELTRHTAVDRRSEIVRDELFQIYLGRPHGGRLNTTMVSELASNALYESFDPRNVTLEAEYYEDVDPAQYGPRKPLIYFWQMLDRSPLGANVWLGLKFRYMLGKHIFRHLGKGVRIYSNVALTFGYNLTIEDNCTIARNAVLDDRSETVLREGTTVDATLPVESSAD